MSGRFTATNGWEVSLNDRGVVVAASPGRGLDGGDAAWTQAMREFFAAERDRELGRERVEGYPDYAVYPIEDDVHPGQITVLDERSGVSAGYVEGRSRYSPEPDAVARAWFAAQEPPKPWLDAKPGEVWALTIEGIERAGVLDADWFMFGPGGVPVSNGSITAGRRIWPTGDAE